MPMRRRRASPPADDQKSSAKRPRHGAKKSSQAPEPASNSHFSTKRCRAWFQEYSGPDDAETIQPDGMLKLCQDIDVEPENIVMLSLAYKLDAKQMGYFTLAEWLKGMSDISVDSADKLRRKLDYLRSLLEDQPTFKNIYRFAFDFARDKDQRAMDIDLAKAMLLLLLGESWSLHSSFGQFLNQSKYKVINKDQWCNVLEFSRTIKSDLSNYDEDGAWPVMLDEFVDWLREKHPETTANNMS